jgi:hypothetical protein
MYLASQGNAEQKPHLSCGGRSWAMKMLLIRVNIYSRLVQIYSDEFEEPKMHRLLEVYNPENNSWEVWDPDYGVTYVDQVSRKPVNIMTMVFSDRNKIIPTGESREGWKETNTEEIKNKYFKAVMFEKDTGLTNAVIIVNKSLFDIEKVYSSGLNFRDWARTKYAYPRIIQLSDADLSLGMSL